MLASASVQDRKRLLELYPVTSLREEGPGKTGTKEELCFEIAEEHQLDRIAQFADEHLGCCKQHIYAFSYEGQFPGLATAELPEVEKIREVKDGENARVFYVVKFEYDVVLRDPLEEVKLPFLWPFRLDFMQKYLLVRFVVMEKNIGSYFERPYYVGRKNLEEKTILQAIQSSTNDKFKIEPADLHKGVKELWEKGFIDSPRASYKKARSTASEIMDENLGIKEHNPDLYETLLESPLFNTLFQIVGQEGLDVSAFSVDPPKGYIAFPRYCERKEDTDYVVGEILRHN